MSKQVFKEDNRLTFSTDLGAEFVSNKVSVSAWPGAPGHNELC